VKKKAARWIAPSEKYVVKTLHRLGLNGAGEVYDTVIVERPERGRRCGGLDEDDGGGVEKDG